MKPLAPRTLTIFAAGVLLLLAGCRDSTAPARVTPDGGQPQAELGAALTAADTVVVLQRREPLVSNITVTKVIGSEGGTISVAGTGLTMNVPAGAVVGPTRFSVTALAGRAVAYEFGPHGSAFTKQVVMTQDLRGTLFNPGAFDHLRLRAGYFASRGNLIDRWLRAVVSELLPASTDTRRMVVRFQVSHFSGYLVAID